MKIEKLENIKKEYLKIQPPKDLMEYGWLALKKEIEATERPKFKFLHMFTRGVVFAVVLITILGGASVGLVVASQKALPGDTLYPVKRFSENITAVVLSKKTDNVENRAEEVVSAAKKNNSVVLENTIKEYQKAVSKAEKYASGSAEKKQEFKKNLEKYEEEFKEVIKTEPSSKQILQDAVDVSRKVREEDVKGVTKEVPEKVEEKDRVLIPPKLP